MENGKLRVSIGLPVFNGEDYLEEALDSILAQTYSNFELIISDNASIDKTQEICRAYMAKDQRIRYYRNKTNLGAAKNHNLVFELSSAEYFKWAAYDDLYDPEYLERCVEPLEREPDVVLCYPRSILIDGDGEVIEYHSDHFNLCSPRPHERFRDSFRGSAWCNPLLGVIRSSLLKKTALIGNYRSSDEVVLRELTLLGKFHEVSEHLFLRRLHQQSSVVANPGDEERAAWFDPTTKGKILAPRWKRFVEYFRVIGRVPLSCDERVRCYIELGRFYLKPEKLKGIIKDLSQISRVVSRLFAMK